MRIIVVAFFHNTQFSSVVVFAIMMLLSLLHFTTSFNARCFRCSRIMRSMTSMSIPRKREMILINNDYSNMKIQSIGNVRIQQFNILADGLSGLRKDMGAFSRASFDFLNWNYRRYLLLSEITQYNPDIVTLQECDHFHDFFLPEMERLGYCGIFAPKPASACLEVSENSDGCAIFFRRSMFDMMSVETLTYSVRKSEVQQALRQSKDSSKGPKFPLSFKFNQDDATLRSQNQVALVLCGLLTPRPNVEPATQRLSSGLKLNQGHIPQKIPIVIATTHLKASKSAEGEIYRLLECRQLIQALERNVEAMKLMINEENVRPAVILTGDLNATPEDRSDIFGFDCAVYSYITSQSKYPLRSVLNDDLAQSRNIRKDAAKDKQNIWTTWKARRKGSEIDELIVKHCIDYILYSPPSEQSVDLLQQGTIRKIIGLQSMAVSDMFRDDEVDKTLLPSKQYPSDHVSIVADFQVVSQQLPDTTL